MPLILPTLTILLMGLNQAPESTGAEVLSPGADVQVQLVQTPAQGIQPQITVDSMGGIHLIFFKGDAAAGDLFYVQKSSNAKVFSKPIRVNSVAGSAIAVGTIRGGQIALGKEGRVHVAWNGSGKFAGDRGVPMFYARMNQRGTGFEDQRNLMQKTRGLDGGGTITADQNGRVFVAWHGLAVASKVEGGSETSAETSAGAGAKTRVETGAEMSGEAARRVWVAISTDSGKTFADETMAWKQSTGACGCCSMRALATEAGSVHMLYRSASDGTRDIFRLSFKLGEQGQIGFGDSVGFEGGLVHRWKVATCPMSSMSLASGAGRVASAWETDGQMYLSWSQSGSPKFTPPLAAPGDQRQRKHPALAINSQGQTLMAWTEGTAWQRGGDLVWQIYDPNGKATSQHGRIEDGIPVWGLPSAAAIGSDFVLFH
jgi:hypothetical protein